MMNLEITPRVRKPRVKCSLTAEQWQLYTSSMKCGTAARKLNAAVRRSFKAAKSREEFVAMMDEVRFQLRDFGASDTEPRCVVEDIADALYGVDEYGQEVW